MHFICFLDINSKLSTNFIIPIYISAESVPDKKVKTADTKMTRKVVLKERVDNSFNKVRSHICL